MRSKLTPIIKFNQRIYKGDNFDNIKITNGSSPITGEFAIAYDALYFKPENEFMSGKISLTIPKDAVMTDNNEINPEVQFTFEIKDNLPYVNISASTSHTIATKNDGSLWAWGYNSNGQLGDGTTTNKTTPVKIMDNVVSTSAGPFHSLAIKNDGSLWAWGYNLFGQLGDRTHTNKTKPVKIMDNVVSTSAGGYHSLAIKNDGSLWAWGDNSDGQLGVGDTKDRIVPTSVWTVSGPKEVDDVTLHNIEIEEEDKFIMYPILNPTDGDYTDIQWESSNKDVAEVDEYGVITAKSEGVATITAKITRLSGDIISANSEITVSTITDISTPVDNRLLFKVENNTIVVKDYENDDRPQLYTISGNAIQPNNDTNNVLSFGPLNKGIYILRFNHFNKKIMIK